MESLSKDAGPDGVGRLIMEEVKGAISAIRYPESFPRLREDFEISGRREMDMFDLLEYVFGFQKDNIRNQRENVILTIANAQSRLGMPVEADPKIDEKAITEVFLKVLDNYIKWCRYLQIRLVWNSLEAINRDRKLFLVSLYFLIWGEAANVRFLPECICYIFHHVLHYPLEQELCLVGHLDRKLQITTCNCTGWIPWVHKLSFWNGGRTKLKEGLLELVSYRISNATFTLITAISICCLF